MFKNKQYIPHVSSDGTCQIPYDYYSYDYDTLCEKCPYSEFSDPNAGKYIPEKLLIRTLFTQWHIKRFDCDRSVLNET